MYTLPSRNQPVVNSANLDPDLRRGNMLINVNFHLEWYCLIDTWVFQKLSGQLTVCVFICKTKDFGSRSCLLSKLREKNSSQKALVAGFDVL